MIKEYQLRKQQNSYEVTLHYKGVCVKVAFTGGSIYKGIMPTFRTDNLFKMKALEASELFKNKEVVVMRTIGDSVPLSRPVIQQRKKAVVTRTAGIPQQGYGGKDAAGVQGVAEGSCENTTEMHGEAVTDKDDANTMEFANLGEAILYIAQEYQTGVQTEKDARKVFSEHGVKVVIRRG